MRPDPVTPSPAPTLADLRHVNDLCNRFEDAWRAGERPRLEDFLADASPVADAVVQLVLLDIDYRRRHGDAPRAEDYLARFPALRPDLLATAFADDVPATLDLRPTALPPGEFLDRLVRLGLIAEGEHLHLLPSVSGTTTAALAERLVAAGKLAEFQAKALSGRVEVPFVLGPYHLDGWIASGGMGQVFRATHVRMKRAVALKVVRGETARKPQALRRFQHEVEVAARLRHPNIVTAFDAGESDGVAYLVTEFVAGEDLARVVRRDGPAKPGVAIGWARQAALGLGHAHAQGIVHRDVKPSNLILDEAGVVRVLDFGLAATGAMSGESSTERPAAQSSLTGTGAVLGTAEYMAPEQADDPRRADARADVYALGCTLFFLMTGRPPFEAATLDGLIHAHRHEPFPIVRSSWPDLWQLVKRMLAKNPADRPADMAAVVAALDGIEPARRLKQRVLNAFAVVVLIAATAYALWPADRHSPSPMTAASLPFDGRAEQQRWADALGLPVETTDDIGIRFVLIPPGEGVGEPFYLGATEVTIDQYRRFVEASRPPYVTQAERDGGWGRDRERGWHFAKGYSWRNGGEAVLTGEHPAVNIAYDDAEAFCRWLTVKTDHLYRLPTEAEWEFACRAGGAGAWSFGDDADELPLYAWTDSDGDTGPRPVGRKRANAFGLFDMHGNLWEWCRPDDGAKPGDEVPMRGGSFRSPAEQTRSASREMRGRGDVLPGFRVVRVMAGR